MVKVQEKLYAILKGIQEQRAWNLSLILLTIGMSSQRFFLKDIPKTNMDLLVFVPCRALYTGNGLSPQAGNNDICDYKSGLKTRFMKIFYVKKDNNDTYFLEVMRGTIKLYI